MEDRSNARVTGAVVGALVVTGVIVAALATGGGSDRAPKPGTSGPGTAANGPQTARPGRIKPRGRRQAVRRGRRGGRDLPGTGTGALLGIADQKPATFADPRFRALGVRRTRLSTPWNSIFTEPGRLATWLDAAHSAGLEPLVAFEHARGDGCPASPCPLPPLSVYERAIRAFHARYPWVTLLQPWNEANSSTQPTGRHPARAAAYYEAARRACPACTITGADLLDSTNVVRWVSRFKDGLHGPVPRLWGLHNYSDVNRFRDTGTRRMLGAVPGEVWLTETGGIVSFMTSAGRAALPYDVNRAARAARYMFRLAARFPRIRRIYIYQWKIDFPGNRFDSGLVAPDGRPRPAFAVVAGKRGLVR